MQKFYMQEYGISENSKISIAQRICTPLLRKIRSDLYRCIEKSDSDESQTRLDPRYLLPVIFS